MLLKIVNNYVNSQLHISLLWDRIYICINFTPSLKIVDYQHAASKGGLQKITL